MEEEGVWAVETAAAVVAFGKTSFWLCDIEPGGGDLEPTGLPFSSVLLLLFSSVSFC